MFEVIICTVRTGRVRRKFFNSWEAARKCVDNWSEKGGYRLELNRVETPTQSLILRPRSVAAAA